MPQTRQLAANMFTDIVWYTALMGNDEQKVFGLFKNYRGVASANIVTADFNPVTCDTEERRRTIGSAHIEMTKYDMYRADGTLIKFCFLYNGLKTVV